MARPGPATVHNIVSVHFGDIFPILYIYMLHILPNIFVVQSCLSLCNPMDYSTSGFPVHHHLQELAQTHVHSVGDVIQPSHPLSSPSPPAFNLS